MLDGALYPLLIIAFVYTNFFLKNPLIFISFIIYYHDGIKIWDRRQMGGGPFPYNLNVRKNKFIEEWNGRREITEKSWTASGKNIPWVVFMTIVFPYGTYALFKSELEKTGGPRYKDMV